MTLGLKSTETIVPPQTSGGLSHVHRDKGLNEAQGCLRSHGNWQLGLETQASQLHKWGDIIVTKASTFWALPECPSHHFRTPFQEACYFPHLTQLAQRGLKCPNGQQPGLGTQITWLRAPLPRGPQHLASCIQRGSTLPSALTIVKARPGLVEGNMADPKGGSGAGLGLPGNWGDP